MVDVVIPLYRPDAGTGILLRRLLKQDYEINRKILDCFDTRPYFSILKTKCKLCLYRVLGRERYFALKHLIKGMRNEQ